MWVQLRARQRITTKGEPRDYHPGDWVNVGRQTAQLWISRGEATIPGGPVAAANLGGSGVVAIGNADYARVRLKEYIDKLGIESGPPRVQFARTAIWDTTLEIGPAWIPTGLSLLEKWEVAAPLCDYETLAKDIGDADERAKTQAVIRDLRVPVYDTRLIFVRRTPETIRMINAWQEEVKDGGDERLSFLRCLYASKPLILALPTTWNDSRAPR